MGKRCSVLLSWEAGEGGEIVPTCNAVATKLITGIWVQLQTWKRGIMEKGKRFTVMLQKGGRLVSTTSGHSDRRTLHV